MIADKLKSKFRASKKTLEDMVAVVNTEQIIAEVEADISLELLDAENPVVNGIELLKHPYRADEFRRVIEQGGCIAVIKNKGKIVTIVTHTKSGRIGKSAEEFDPCLSEYRLNNVVGRVGEVIQGNFMSFRGEPGRPKNMTPDDFWGQLTDREWKVVDSSDNPDVDEFVNYVNGLKKVNPTTKKCKAGINLLFTNNLITPKTFERLSE